MMFQHRIIAFCFLGLETIKEVKRGVDMIDHKDHNTLNNCVENLRITDNSGNSQNRSNVKGYRLDRDSGKYRATITLNYKQIHLGFYATEDEARTAYLDAKRKYHLE